MNEGTNANDKAKAKGANATPVRFDHRLYPADQSDAPPDSFWEMFSKVNWPFNQRFAYLQIESFHYLATHGVDTYANLRIKFEKGGPKIIDNAKNRGTKKKPGTEKQPSGPSRAARLVATSRERDI